MRGSVKAVDLILKYNILLMLVALLLASSLLSEAFFTTQNAFNLLRQLAPLMLASLGMLLVVLTGGIDLSVGSVAAVGGMVVALSLSAFPDAGGAGLVLAVLAALASGLALGAVTGFFVSVFRMAPFIASLAMMTIARGMAYLISNGQPIRFPRDLVSSQWLTAFGSKGVPGVGLPWPVVLALAVVFAFHWVMKNTTYGRLTIATGSNEVAVRLAGISEIRYKFLAYFLCGGLSAAAGVIATSRAGVGTPITGAGLELDAIAACVIGGALLSGGKGSVLNTVIGVIILGLIGNIMNLMSVPAYPQQIIKGTIIVLAVLLQSVGGRTIRI
ncbi:ABC transporter permease [Ensifer sp. YR511]|uniref:ABC transporter permease n=1 Tax=Ensifer sp. YR511 TaxID=1855294 RepID=UPI00088DA2FF|nr:ABC transporter permease [Ensifer sp. YR511]SDN03603.1 ribose transport system permease protein [Ensifer sp. YR511]